MLSSFRLVVFLALIAVSSACSTFKAPPDIINSSANDAKLVELTRWELRGRMAFSSDSERFSANVRWQQSGDDFEYVLTNLLGVTLLSLNYENGMATLKVDGEEFQGEDPEVLIWQTSGWQIPIESLKFWVKGLARQRDLVQRDERGLLREIIPSGTLNTWQANFTTYQLVDDVVLPQQLTLERQMAEVKIRLKINQWTL